MGVEGEGATAVLRDDNREVLDALPPPTQLLAAEPGTDSGVRTMTTDMRVGLPSRLMAKRTMASWLLLSASACKA